MLELSGAIVSSSHHSTSYPGGFSHRWILVASIAIGSQESMTTSSLSTYGDGERSADTPGGGEDGGHTSGYEEN